MTQYNSVSGVRFGLQMATVALFYAAARYKKVDGLTSAASRIGIAAVVQGVSQKTHAPLGERTKMSWLADGISLGLVAYGMSYTDLAKRTKWITGGTIFGSQLIISNLKSNTALARIDKIETKEECAEVYEELTLLFRENAVAITPEQGIKTCKAFFQKASSVSDSGGESLASNILNVYSDFLNELQGWRKVKAQMEYIEVVNAAGFYDSNFVANRFFTEPLEEREQAQFDLWMAERGTTIKEEWSQVKSPAWETVKGRMEKIEELNTAKFYTDHFFNFFPEQLIETLEKGERAQFDLWMEKMGRPIQLRWSTWAMEKAGHQEVYQTITEYINGIGDKITFAQKIDLCEQFYVKSIDEYAHEDFKGSPPQKMLAFRGGLMNTLDGVERAKAYMAFAEFSLENHIVIPETLDQAILRFRETLDESGKATIDAWMETTGRFIQLCRSIQSMESAGHQGVYEAITQYIDGIGDSITFAQKIDLCEQFYIKSKDCYGGSFSGSPSENILKFREELMNTLNGIEKAKAYMAYAEFLSENNTTHPDLFNRIIPAIRETLDENGQAAVDAWMGEKGTAIQEKWRQ